MSGEASLPRGVTGFHVAEQAEGAAEVRVADFKRVCHEAARALGLTLWRFDSAERAVAPSFHVAALRGFDDPVFLLCHRTFPWLALAKASPLPLTPVAFTDHAALGQVLAVNERFQLLGADSLERPLTAELLRNLAPVELEQIRYWRPERVGDLIFHWWD